MDRIENISKIVLSNTKDLFKIVIYRTDDSVEKNRASFV
jgi:hypothetical protein